MFIFEAKLLSSATQSARSQMLDNFCDSVCNGCMMAYVISNRPLHIIKALLDVNGRDMHGVTYNKRDGLMIC